jgi:RecA-family ATPase
MADVQPFRPRLAAHWSAHEPPPRRWIVPDLLPAGTVSMLTGDGGCGKSTLMVQLALAASAGGDWLGHHVSQETTLGLFAEDDADEIGRRLRAASVDGGDLSAANRLHVLSKEDVPDPVIAIGRDGAVAPTQTFKRLLATVQSVQPTLIILDPLAELFAGNENVRSEVARFVRLVSALSGPTGAAVILVAHPSVTGMASGSGLSGSTGWNGSVRSRLYLTAPDKADPTRRRLEVLKSNYGPTGQIIDMRYADGRFIRLAPRTAADARNEEMGIDNLFLSLLARMNAEGRSVSPAASRSYGPTILARLADARGVTMKAFERAMDRLLADGRIAVRWDGPPSKRRQRLIVVDGTEASNPPSNLMDGGANRYALGDANPPANASNPPTNGVSFQPPIPPAAGTAGRLNADRPGSHKKAVRMNGHGGSDARGPPS